MNLYGSSYDSEFNSNQRVFTIYYYLYNFVLHSLCKYSSNHLNATKQKSYFLNFYIVFFILMLDIFHLKPYFFDTVTKNNIVFSSN